MSGIFGETEQNDENYNLAEDFIPMRGQAIFTEWLSAYCDFRKITKEEKIMLHKALTSAPFFGTLKKVTVWAKGARKECMVYLDLCFDFDKIAKLVESNKHLFCEYTPILSVHHANRFVPFHDFYRRK